MAQVLEIMRALQDDEAASRMAQEKMQADLAASQGRNEDLNRVNEEVRQSLEAQKERVVEEVVVPPPPPPRTFPMPFSSEIMGAVVPTSLVGVKASFTGVEVVRLPSKDEDMLVHAFKKGVLAGPFSESLIRHRPSTFVENRCRVVAHITAEIAVSEKRESVIPNKTRAGPSRTQQPMRVHEAKEGKRAQGKPRPYKPRRDQNGGRTSESNAPPRFDFVVELAEMIAIPAIAARLRAPEKTDRVLGRKKDVWCEFHQAYGHPLRACLALGHQLAELVKNGFLSDYLREPQGDQVSGDPSRGSVAQVDSAEEDHSPDVDIVFTKADLRDVVPHDNDPVVISLVTAGRKVHRVLVDQGSSADVMFWPTFSKLQLSLDHLKPYPGCFYGFARDQVEVRGYVELRTTFTDGATARTEKIKYLVVNAPSAYKILLGRPTLNRLGAVPSTRHMKVKMPSMEGVVVTIKSDQKEARRYYENSLKQRRSV
ncbi:uncharacterized protein [Phaseolus vulgaris]|uniref:uncharacterized protein n=1 Tax=Phaseolus vulgaris TaxID=3885 RepID=UPI0035CA6E57